MFKIVGYALAVIFSIAGLAKLFLNNLPQDLPITVLGNNIPSWSILFLISGILFLISDSGPDQNKLLEKLLVILKKVRPSLFEDTSKNTEIKAESAIEIQNTVQPIIQEPQTPPIVEEYNKDEPLT